MIRPAKNTPPVAAKPVKKSLSTANKELKDSKKVVKPTVAAVAKKDRSHRKLDISGLREKMQLLTSKALSS